MPVSLSSKQSAMIWFASSPSLLFLGSRRELQLELKRDYDLAMTAPILERVHRESELLDPTSASSWSLNVPILAQPWLDLGSR